jgi:UDP-3-O-[3-hydroxymyristoyl] glucosamine N-acyltransferase
LNNIHFKIKNLAKIINAEIIGDKNIVIKGISDIETAEKGDITFLSNMKYLKYINKTNASAIIIDERVELPSKSNITFLKVKDSYSTFGLLLSEIEKLNISKKEGIEKPNFIDSTVNIKKDVYIGAFSYIGKNVKIGSGTKIFPYTYIGENTEIGESSIIYPGVKIYNSTKIGNKCIIHANSVIGSDGFGFAINDKGEYSTIPQIGNVIIKDNVSIGSNTVIDRATLKSTIINKGVKMDNLIQIAHNVIVGENTVIAAQSGVAGSSTIGKNNMIGGQVGIVGHIKMGDNIKYAAQTGVTKNMKSNQTLIGYPAMPKEKYIKSYIIFKKLPSIEEKIKKLEEKLYNLQSK